MASSDDYPRLTAVCLLEAYAQVQDKGNTAFKSAMWNINKARRQSGSTSMVDSSIAASSVRAELRARAVLRQAIPDLVEGTDRTQSDSDEDYFELVDAVEELSTIRDGGKENILADKSNEDGLRNRKATSKKQEWTEETSPDEDDRLRNADPLDLFGALPPRDLRTAQKEARKALAAYIEAANLAAAILSVTKK